MTNLDSIFKSRDITLPTKIRLVKAMVFPVVMYGCESWTVKKAERWRIDAFELWCWGRLMRFPWTARRSNQSILKEISPGISLEGMMLKLKLQYFGHLLWRVDSWKRLWCWEGLGAGEEGDDRGWDAWLASWLNGHESEWTPVFVMDREAWHAAIHGVAKNRTRLSDWTELNSCWIWRKTGQLKIPIVLWEKLNKKAKTRSLSLGTIQTPICSPSDLLLTSVPMLTPWTGQIERWFKHRPCP